MYVNICIGKPLQHFQLIKYAHSTRYDYYIEPYLNFDLS